VFSSLGFYPVCPGSGEYAIGSPSVKEGKIQLAGGKSLTIKANNLTDKNIYIQSVKLNGKPVNTTSLSNSEINQGGELVFEMGGKPNKKWGVK
jgi:putative alpha-1,2-mannosidase